ncbi:MAG: hypothetical protein FWD76_01890 [Firmicutes bacterium]|nr:hypothetical protein [Bacillota bacterium]
MAESQMYPQHSVQPAQQGVEYKGMGEVSTGGVGLAAAGGAALGTLLFGDDRFGGRRDRGGDFGGERGRDREGNIVVVTGQGGNGGGTSASEVRMLSDTMNTRFDSIEATQNTSEILGRIGGLETRFDNATRDTFGVARAVDRVGASVDLAKCSIIANDDRNSCEVGRLIDRNRFDTQVGFNSTNHNIDNKFCDLALQTERNRGENTAQHKEILCRINEVSAKQTAELLAFENRRILAEKDAKIAQLEREQIALGTTIRDNKMFCHFDGRISHLQNCVAAGVNNINAFNNANIGRQNSAFVAGGVLTAADFFNPTVQQIPEQFKCCG